MSAPVALVMAGGTGGHVYPALALARELQARSWQVVWLGTRRGLEARVVPAERIPIERLGISGLRGKGLLAWLAAPFRLWSALRQARAVIRRHQPRVVVGLGGFVSGPGGVAAWLARRPLLVHEQNAIAGLTNRLLARLAHEVLMAFPGAFGPGVAARVIGNPVRADIAALPSPAERFAQRGGPVRLLVVGGSLGATRLNGVVPAALEFQVLDSLRFAIETKDRAGRPTASRTSPLPESAELHLDRVKGQRAHKAVALERCRHRPLMGEPVPHLLEWSDETHRFRMAAPVAHRADGPRAAIAGSR